MHKNIFLKSVSLFLFFFWKNTLFTHYRRRFLCCSIELSSLDDSLTWFIALSFTDRFHRFSRCRRLPWERHKWTKHMNKQNSVNRVWRMRTSNEKKARACGKIVISLSCHSAVTVTYFLSRAGWTATSRTPCNGREQTYTDRAFVQSNFL